jgi:phosphoribosylaminoimidazole carboxylase
MKKTVGIIGGGQLGRMLIEYGIRRLASSDDVKIRVLNLAADCSVSRYADQSGIEIIVGDYQSETDLRKFAAGCDVITWEIEHANIEVLQRLEDEGMIFIPKVCDLRIIQDKAIQKEFFEKRSFSVVDYVLSTNPIIDFWGTSAQQQLQQDKYTPVVYKSRRAGFDGRGVWIVANIESQPEIFKTGPIIIERFIENREELSVIVVRDGINVVAYEPVAMSFHRDDANILDGCCPATDGHVLIGGAPIPASHLEFCKEMAIAMSSALPGKVGLYAFEMFYVRKPNSSDDFNLHLNEVAARVHNSGHHTIHTHNISQFEELARVLLGYPLQEPRQLYRSFFMRNLFCNHYPYELPDGGPYRLVNHLCIPSNGPFVVDYQKGMATPWRKLGHITHVGSDCMDVYNEMEWYQRNNAIEMVVELKPTAPPIVGIVMGSESDFTVMIDACKCLKELDVPFEVTVVSAHRTPDRLVDYAKTAESRGIQVIIAGAGGAAHLPGMIAANTAVVPVIGVPIKTMSLNGLDSLYSIVQMPAGVPVACMAINGARNAAIFAAQVLKFHSSLKEQRKMTQDAVMQTASFRNVKIYDQ